MPCEGVECARPSSPSAPGRRRPSLSLSSRLEKKKKKLDSSPCRRRFIPIDTRSLASDRTDAIYLISSRCLREERAREAAEGRGTARTFSSKTSKLRHSSSFEIGFFPQRAERREEREREQKQASSGGVPLSFLVPPSRFHLRRSSLTIALSRR